MPGSNQSKSAASGPPERRFLDVARATLAAINGGTYAPLGKLPGDRDLAAAHGVSRTTAREALLALELIGAIVIKHGDGAYVSTSGSTTIDESRALLTGEPRHVIESRRVLEPITTRLAAARLTADELNRLDASLDAAEKVAGDLSQFRHFAQLGFEFHSALAACCGNDLLAEFVGQLVSVEQHPLWVLVNEQLVGSPPARLIQVAEHRAVVAALRERDADAAERCMRSHLEGLENAAFFPHGTF